MAKPPAPSTCSQKFRRLGWRNRRSRRDIGMARLLAAEGSVVLGPSMASILQPLGVFSVYSANARRT
jgi:hypothetical protein